MRDGALKPYKVIVRCPHGRTTYATDTFPDIDAMFAGSRAVEISVFWRNWYGGGIQKDTRQKYAEIVYRLTHRA